MKRFIQCLLVTFLLTGCGTNTAQTETFDYYKTVDLEQLTFDEAYKYYEEGNSGVLFMSFVDCPYCEAAYPIFREICDEYKDVPVYYVNIDRSERDNGQPTYDLWVEALDEFLDPENKTIFIPTVIALNKGTIMASVVGTVSDLEDMSKPEEIEKQRDAYRNVFYRAGD